MENDEIEGSDRAEPESETKESDSELSIFFKIARKKVRAGEFPRINPAGFLKLIEDIFEGVPSKKRKANPKRLKQ